MKIHYHGSIEDILMTGIAAIIVIDLLGITAAYLSKQKGVVGTLGQALGAVVPFAG